MPKQVSENRMYLFNVKIFTRTYSPLIEKSKVVLYLTDSFGFGVLVVINIEVYPIGCVTQNVPSALIEYRNVEF